VVEIEKIPGVKEAGWRPPPRALRAAEPPRKVTELEAKFGAVFKAIKNVKDAWPFLQPVNGKLVPDYYDIIKEPMDLEKVQGKLDRHEYKTREQFIYDFNLIFNNCRTYNEPHTTYYRCADTVEKIFNELLTKLGV